MQDRFDQKNNMYYLGEWNSAYSYLNRENKYDSLRRRLEQGTPGYTKLDDALLEGASSVLRALNININRANWGGNAWAGGEAGRRHEFSSPEEAAQVVKSAAALYGADDMGTCRLKRNRIYSHYFDPQDKRSFPIRFSDDDGYSCHSTPGLAVDRSLVIPADMKHVIVLLVEMDFSAVETAPALPQTAATAAAYSKLACLVTSLTGFVRSLGYKAIPSLNCTGLNIPLAIDAGLGQLGRNGLLVHPRFGPRCRIAKIITDMPLPQGQANTGYLKDFCSKCKKCAIHCPAQAISHGEPSSRPKGDFSTAGIAKWQVDYGKCREYWVESGTNCGVCVAVCTFNRKGHQSKLRPPECFWQQNPEK